MFLNFYETKNNFTIICPCTILTLSWLLYFYFMMTVTVSQIIEYCIDAMHVLSTCYLINL